MDKKRRVIVAVLFIFPFDRNRLVTHKENHKSITMYKNAAERLLLLLEFFSNAFPAKNSNPRPSTIVSSSALIF